MATKQWCIASLIACGVLVGCGGGGTSSPNQPANDNSNTDPVVKTVTAADEATASSQAVLPTPVTVPVIQGSTTTTGVRLQWVMQEGVSYSLVISDVASLSANSVAVDAKQVFEDIQSPFTLPQASANPQFILLEARRDDTQVYSDTLMVAHFSETLQTHEQQSYTKLDETGAVLSDDANDWQCVLDNHTGLIWEVEADINPERYVWTETDRDDVANGQGLCNSHLAGACTTRSAQRTTNQQQLCSQANWRLPSTFELAGLSKLDTSMPAIDTRYFPNTQNGHYWAAEVFVKNHGYAWNVSFDYGHAMTIDANALDPEHGYLRLVSEAANPLFTVAKH